MASRFAIAYLSSLPGAAADLRRQRCRPFDTDQLDRQLGAATWSGAGEDTPVGATATVTVTSVNATSATGDAVGYELAATVTVTAAGQPVGRDQRALELWLVPSADGRWRVDQVR